VYFPTTLFGSLEPRPFFNPQFMKISQIVSIQINEQTVLIKNHNIFHGINPFPTIECSHVGFGVSRLMDID